MELADLSQAVDEARARVVAEPRSVPALVMLDAALHARGEFLWSRGEPEAIDDFHGCVAANESRATIAADDAGGFVALVRSFAIVAEWNTQQQDAEWALEYLQRAMAASRKVGQRRAAGRSLPENAGESLAALQRSLELFAQLAERGPLRPGTAEKISAFFESLRR